MSHQELTTTEQAAEEPEVAEVAAPEVSPEAVDATETEVEVAIVQSETAATGDAVEEAASSVDAAAQDAAAQDAVEDTPEQLSIHSLKPGQNLKGKIKNITEFGAFVDIGLPQDGLVHISELARKKVAKVQDVVSEGEEVEVWIKKIDTRRGRISLTMVKPISLRLRDIAEEAELEGTVSRLESYGAFIDIGSERDGLVHISQITHDYIKHPEDTLTIGDAVNVKVLKVNRKKRQVDLSIKALLPLPVKPEEAVNKVVKEVKEVIEVAKAGEGESVPTAMALAFAALQGKGESEDSQTEADFQEGKRKRKKEMSEIVARTLATSE